MIKVRLGLVHHSKGGVKAFRFAKRRKIGQWFWLGWLVERSHWIIEVRGSNQVIGKIYIEHLLTVNCIEKTKIKKKEAGNDPFLKEKKDIQKHSSSICIAFGSVGRAVASDSRGLGFE